MAMALVKLRPKPRPRDESVRYAAKFIPGDDLAALTQVARMADLDAALTQVPYGALVYLVVVTERWNDNGYCDTDAEVVKPGDWLYWSGKYLHSATDTEIARWYDVVIDDA